ncbi:MAG: IS30 family transposase [Candidatus Omnitrophota bacterium]|nr:IS30 family transposase [Candidatus Omnitrophota bacterium]
MSYQYHRLTMNEREEISLGLAQGKSRRDIASMLQRSPATVSREIRRNNYIYGGYQYRAAIAHSKARRRAHMHRKSRKLNTNERLRQFVFEHLDKRWTPEQIAKSLKKLYPMDMNMRISHESIYSYLYLWPRGELRKIVLKCLRRKHKYRREYGKVHKRRGSIQDFISIEERPKEVADRIIPGHWEGDLLMGHNNASALGVLVERTTRMIFLVRLKDKDAQTVRVAFARKFKHLPEGLKRSLTYDNGQEMAEHKLFTKNTRIQVYFAHPHSPWERGTSENTNDILRQFFPKGINFNKVSLRQINKIQNLVNDRPRKILDFSTPHEVFVNLLH